MEHPLNKAMHVLIVIIAITLASLALYAPTSAQYPAPLGAVEGASQDTTLSVNSSTVLTCNVLDTAGNPVSGEPCTFTIISEPGTDAAVGSKAITKLTDANGIARTTLFAGSTPGHVVVKMEARGLASQVTVQVQTQASSETPDGQAPQAPSAPAGAQPAQPPSTGAGSEDGDSDWWRLAVVGAVLLLIYGMFALKRRRA